MKLSTMPCCESGIGLENFMQGSEANRFVAKAEFISKDPIVGHVRNIPIPSYARSYRLKGGEIKFFRNSQDISAGLYGIPEEAAYIQFPEYREHFNGHQSHIHYGEPKFIDSVLVY